MQCPNDATTLVMSERSGIEIDYCPECRGIWLDRGELDKLIERSAEQQPHAAQAQHQPYGQQQPGYGQGYGQQGSSDTVGKIADKVLRTVQQRTGGQQQRQPYGDQRYDPRYGDQRQRGSRGWLGDILG
ncbi:zf-TFIIB domain-containing protein [Agrococcus sp. SCSIO52902]|uniref:TFIIB-type zinc ribbon-containing protein n=1 Tax=Agrococcus sp. SCSIO52902 TaxID=2933290 RepID=UPI001FF18071|nr:zf-TFIIB domain-containing protein [Agrococcus sp. SCSIO52902]UOW01035.1 zf-TFIIB domain-containing protein [Agrococcus sp. SCSIO52902]